MSAPEGRTRVLLAGTDARLRLHLRRLLADFPDIDVAGHARPGTALAEAATRTEAGVLLLDATADPAAATGLMAEARRGGLRLVVVTAGAPLPDAGRCAQIRRPTALEDEPPRSSFGAALAAALRGPPGASASAPASAGPPGGAPAAPGSGANPAPAPFHKGRGDEGPAVVTRAPTVIPQLARPRPLLRPEIIAIGSSTGGPQALPEVLAGLVGRIRQPIIITQHMPAAFTTMLAEHLGRRTGIPTVEARDGMPLEPGRIHLAPGGRHLLLVRERDQVFCQLDDGPPENFCKPAVDPMLRAVVRMYGGRALAVILTGMGHDGLQGCRELVEAGGAVLAQDEATSVVWGMPGAVAQAGLCQAVLPLDRIAASVVSLAGVVI